MTGFSRAKFTHWAGRPDACGTREVVPKRSGQAVKRAGECKAVEGTWTSVYDGITATDAGKLTIDHMIPIANAWSPCAQLVDCRAPQGVRERPDPPQLLAVSAATNREKADQGPDDWQPPAKTYGCTCPTPWTNVKNTHHLTATQTEKTKLTEMLETCRWPPNPTPTTTPAGKEQGSR
ncbi:hypothetical protein ACODT5_03945 [Streptomyces sp. 5.8]|uniref:hypothetical protein n=1 Tax=Streptomyces sp. 5.8 TaxID=3406571 RepID=UPI003BB679A6